MKIEKIRNGALYYNTETKRTERVIGRVSPVRVLTYWHQKEERSWNASKLEIASQAQVDEYLDKLDLSPIRLRLKKARALLSNMFKRQREHA
jgi:hypothetical protein